MSSHLYISKDARTSSVIRPIPGIFLTERPLANSMTSS